MRLATAFLGLLLAGVLAACGTTRPAAPAPTLSVVTFNIWHNQSDWPGRLAQILAELRALAPDVICLQEVLQNPELPNQAQTIADSLGYHVYFASVDSVGRPKRYGNAILTRHPVLATHWRALDPADDYRNAAHLRLAWAGRPVDVYTTHLHYSGADGGEAVRSRQIRDLLAFIDATAAGASVILTGDFNTLPGNASLRLLDDRFLDAYALLHPGADRPTTLNPHAGHTPRWIDYLFVARAGGRDAGLRPVAAEVVFDRPGPDSLWASDHFGVYTRLVSVSSEP